MEREERREREVARGSQRVKGARERERKGCEGKVERQS